MTPEKFVLGVDANVFCPKRYDVEVNYFNMDFGTN